MGDLKRLLPTAGCALLAALLAAGIGHASDCTYYVRAGFIPTQGVADGITPERAFSTIGQGVQAVTNAGDVLCVGPGLYTEGDLTLIGASTHGTASFPIEIRGDATGAATNDPPGPVQIVPPSGLPVEQTPGAAFRLFGHRYVVIEGFEISDFRDAGIQVRSANTGSDNSSNVTIRHNVIRNCRTGIDVYAEDMIVVEGNAIVASSSSGISVQSCATSNEFGTCRAAPSGPVVPIVSNNRSGGNGAHGIFLKGGMNAVVQNNVTYSNGFTGIALRGVPDALIANNLIYRNGQEGLSIGAGAVTPGGSVDAATLAAPNAIVLNNTIFENAEWGIEIGNSLAASPGAAVFQNIVWRNGAGRLGIGVLNERGHDGVVHPSVCNYVAGFNDVLDGYGPDTPHNVYDLRVDPLFVNPEGPDGVAGGEIVDGQFIDRSADDDFRLRQGSGTASRAVDAGGLLAAQIGLTGSTASSGAADTGRADLGYHYGASPQQVLAFEVPFMPLYVRGGGLDTNDGKLPTNAFATIATAARRARAGITVVVGPGTYRECDIGAPPDSGRATFLADASGERTGDAPGTTLLDAGRCTFDPVEQTFSPGQTGFNVSSVCGAVIDGFHVTGASDDGIQLQNQSDGAVIRNNVLFANGKRGLNVLNSDDVRIANNLAYGNGTGGIQIGSGSRTAEQCASSGTRRALIEFNTAYRNTFNGIQIGTGACPSTGAMVRYNVTGENGKRGIEVGSDATRAQELIGYQSAYNLVADRYGTGVPRGTGDLLIDLAIEPLYLDPTAIVTSGDWRLNRNFRLAQLATGSARQSRAVDRSDVTALQAGMSTRSTRSDGQPDGGMADLGYHYPTGGTLIGDCNDDGTVAVNEIVKAVNIALGNLPLAECAAASSDGEEVTIADLIAAVNAGLGNG
jgi:parallel beta-helix repeat protein